MMDTGAMVNTMSFYGIGREEGSLWKWNHMDMIYVKGTFVYVAIYIYICYVYIYVMYVATLYSISQQIVFDAFLPVKTAQNHPMSTVGWPGLSALTRRKRRTPRTIRSFSGPKMKASSSVQQVIFVWKSRSWEGLVQDPFMTLRYI